MNGLPELRTNIDVTPGINARSSLLLRAAQLKNMQQENVLRGKQIEDYDSDRERKDKLEKIALKIKGIDYALKVGGSSAQMGKAYEEIVGEKASFEIGADEKSVSVILSDGYKLSGPRDVVSEGVEAMAKNPEYIKNPKTWRYLVSNGVTIESPQKEKSEYKTYWGPSGMPHTIDISREVPPENWSDKPPEKEKTRNKEQLTADALKGDPEAKAILDEMIKQSESQGEASARGKLKGLFGSIDIEGTAQRIIDGKEILDNVHNTFGVPIQEVVRAKVLEKEPEFNFTQPRAIYNSLKSSLAQQQKNRGAMGSFVGNINGQIEKLDIRFKDIIKRVGVRGLDVPLRELNTRFIGSGHENVLAAYMKEISAEINKLSQGSTASVAQLPEQSRKEWERIHDVNLPLREIRKVLEGTREMANIRLNSVDQEIDLTIDELANVRKKRSTPEKPKTDEPQLLDDDFEIISVED